jgi:hypothetical protein
METSGEIGMLEGRKACAPLNKHILGWKRHFQWFVVAGMLVSGFIGQSVVDVFAPGYGSLAFLLVCVVAFYFLLTMGPKITQAAWVARGVPASAVVNYRIDEKGLVIQSRAVETCLAWSGVSEIIMGGESWLFVSQASAYFLPRRLFHDQTDEAGFIGACLARLSSEARDRSAKAVAVAALV